MCDLIWLELGLCCPIERYLRLHKYSRAANISSGGGTNLLLWRSLGSCIFKTLPSCRDEADRKATGIAKIMLSC